MKVKASWLLKLLAAATLAKLLERLCLKYKTVDSLKIAFCKEVQSHKKVPGFLRGVACAYATGVSGSPANEPAEPETVPWYVYNFLTGLGIEPGRRLFDLGLSLGTA